VRLRIRLAAVAATAFACLSFGLTGPSPASATVAGWALANYLPKAGTDSTAMCLTAGSNSGNTATIKTCGSTTEDAPQMWHWKGNFDGSTYLPMANGYDLCLSVKNGSKIKGTILTAATCDSSRDDQKWLPLLDHGCSHNSLGSFYPFKNKKSGYVMGVQGGSMTDGTPTIIWSFNRQCDQQHWGGFGD
jgi:hypothetical protein